MCSSWFQRVIIVEVIFISIQEHEVMNLTAIHPLHATSNKYTGYVCTGGCKDNRQPQRPLAPSIWWRKHKIKDLLGKIALVVFRVLLAETARISSQDLLIQKQGSMMLQLSMNNWSCLTMARETKNVHDLSSHVIKESKEWRIPRCGHVFLHYLYILGNILTTNIEILFFRYSDKLDWQKALLRQ